MYDHYVAVDWAQSNMAVARLTKQSVNPTVKDVPASLDDLKVYLASLRGKTILTFEETTTAHWLYVELREYVDQILVCDPYRNKLLSEGAQNDRIDAKKLVQLLKAGLLKPVYHSADHLISLRKITSGYEDLIQRGVRLKNQKSAILRGLGKDRDETLDKKHTSELFVLEGIERGINSYEEERQRYEKEFARLVKTTTLLRFIDQIPGIGLIGAMKIGAAVVSGERFPHRNHFLAYCGLVRLDLTSGGRNYGTRQPRYRRDLKAVMKTAALCAINGNNCFTAYYHYLIDHKRYSDHNARHAVARKIATAVYGVMKNKRRFNPNELGALKALSK